LPDFSPVSEAAIKSLSTPTTQHENHLIDPVEEFLGFQSSANLTSIRGIRTPLTGGGGGGLQSSPHSSKKFFDSGDYALHKAGILLTPVGQLHASPDTIRASSTLSNASLINLSPCQPNSSPPPSVKSPSKNSLLPPPLSSPCLFQRTKLGNSLSMDLLPQRNDDRMDSEKDFA
jgi:hypothetical protein